MDALEIDGDERISRLLDDIRSSKSTVQDADSLRQSNPDVAAEVISLLETEQALQAAIADCRQIDGDDTVSRAQVASVDTEGDPKIKPAGSSAVAESIGRYRITGCLGRGGMGAVYEASDPQLQRRVAIKIPHFAGSIEKQEVSRRRFLREARSAAAVEHPNVCPIYDVGEHDGQPFVVMGFIDGESLADRLRHQGAFDPRTAASLTMKIAAGLSAVHAHQIVHRDLKPANILLRRKEGEPILTDFGLAQFTLEDENLTGDGVILGTPAYMSPEQADPALGSITKQSDLYSLGVILFEMVTGQRPFGGSTVQIISQVSSKHVPRAKALRPDLDPFLDGIIAKATARDSKDRFAKSEDFAKALSEWLGGVESAQTATIEYRPGVAKSALKRQRLFAAIAGITAVFLLVIGGRYLLREHKPDERTSEPGYIRSVTLDPVDPGSGAVAPIETKSNVVPPVDARPLRGAIDVKVWRKDRKDDPPMLLNHPAALPLAPGDYIRIEVELNRPAYIYVVWIDTEGKATPVYPWLDGWTKRPKIEKRQAKMSLPESATGIAPLDPGPAGIETLLLLARDEPLPANEDLSQLFAGLPKQKTADPRAAAWFENGDLVRNEVDRGPIRLDKATERDDPVLKTQALLRTRLQGLFPYSRAVSFANKGD